MARIRTIKPSFWADPAVAGLRREMRLMLIGLISFSDDEGRFLASPSAIAGYVFPHDDLPLRTIRAWRDAIDKSGIIAVYVADGMEFGHFPKWTKHQKINRPTPSVYPQPHGVTHGSFNEPLSEPLSEPLTEEPVSDSRPPAQARVARGDARVGDRRQETGDRNVTQVSSRPTEPNARGIDDDAMTKIIKATRSDHDHAARVTRDILDRANGTVRDPVAYVLRAIGDEPARYRPTPRPPRKDEVCQVPGHSDWAGSCSQCATEGTGE